MEKSKKEISQLNILQDLLNERGIRVAIFQSRKRKYNMSVEWVKEHAHLVDTLSESKADHFTFLENILKDKRIVWLGENGHGIAEHNLLKTKLIDFLYHKMGFKVIAFESGLTECYTSNFLKDELSLDEFIDHSVFPFWKTEETYSLFQSLKASEDFNLIGFDFQPSSKQSLLIAFLNKINIDFPLEFKQDIQKVEENTAHWYGRISKYRGRRKRVPKETLQEYKFIQSELNEIIDQLYDLLMDRKKDFINNGLDLPFTFIQKELDNRRLFLNHLTDNYQDYMKYRDQIMAANLEWICNELYPNEKIMIWAHNAHIYKNYQASNHYRPMGSLISKELMDDSYYMGLFMYEGEAHLLNRTVYRIGPPPKKSLENYMNHTDSPVSFLDFSNVTAQPYNKWIFEKTLILEHGTVRKFIIPAEQLSGVFFVKKVSPPRYL